MGDDHPAWTKESPSSAEARSFHDNIQFDNQQVTVASAATDTSIVFENHSGSDNFVYLMNATIIGGYTDSYFVEFEWVTRTEDTRVNGNGPGWPVTTSLPLPWKDLGDIEVTVINNDSVSHDFEIELGYTT